MNLGVSDEGDLTVSGLPEKRVVVFIRPAGSEVTPKITKEQRDMETAFAIAKRDEELELEAKKAYQEKLRQKKAWRTMLQKARNEIP